VSLKNEKTYTRFTLRNLQNTSVIRPTPAKVIIFAELSVSHLQPTDTVDLSFTNHWRGHDIITTEKQKANQ
jgi:hypothetical protein